MNNIFYEELSKVIYDSYLKEKEKEMGHYDVCYEYDEKHYPWSINFMKEYREYAEEVKKMYPNSSDSSKIDINKNENKNHSVYSVITDKVILIDDDNLPYVVFSEDFKVIAKTKTEEMARNIVDPLSLYNINGDKGWRIARLQEKE